MTLIPPIILQGMIFLKELVSPQLQKDKSNVSFFMLKLSIIKISLEILMMCVIPSMQNSKNSILTMTVWAYSFDISFPRVLAAIALKF